MSATQRILSLWVLDPKDRVAIGTVRRSIARIPLQVDRIEKDFGEASTEQSGARGKRNGKEKKSRERELRQRRDKRASIYHTSVSKDLVW